MRPTIVTPATALIDLERAKLHCKITSGDRDAEVSDAIAAAQSWAQAWLGVALGKQRLAWTFDAWSGCFTAPYDVTSVETVTAAGAPLTYTLSGRTVSAAANAAVPVVITINCGLDGTQLPPAVKSAMLLVIGDLIRNQEAHVDVQLYRNPAVENLLSLERERLPI